MQFENVQDVQRYFEQIRNYKSLIKSKEREKANIKATLGSLSSPKLTERVQSSTTNDSTIKAIENIDMLEKLIDDEIAHLTEIYICVHNKINKLSDNLEKSVLTDIYINCLSVDIVAKLNNYSKRQLYRIHDNALKHVTQCH